MTEATRTAPRADAPDAAGGPAAEPTPRPERLRPEPAVGSDDAAIGRNETPSAAGPARGATSASPESIPPESAPPGGGDFPSRRLTPADLRLLELAHDPGAFPGGLHFTVANIDRLARAGDLESTRRLRNLCRRADVAVGDDASGITLAGRAPTTIRGSVGRVGGMSSGDNGRGGGGDPRGAGRAERSRGRRRRRRRGWAKRMGGEDMSRGPSRRVSEDGETDAARRGREKGTIEHGR